MSSPTHPSHDANAAEQAAEARPKGWKLKVSALALAGVAMIGAVFALKGGAPGLPREPPFIAAAQGPTKVQPPSDETVTASNDAGGSLLKDNAKPASVKVVSSEEQPVDLSARRSIGNPSAARANPPAAADLAKSPAGGLSVTPVAATVDTPLVPPPAAAPPPPMTSEFPTPKPVRTVSLRPDGTPIAASNPPDQSATRIGRLRRRPPPPLQRRRRPASLRRRRRAMRLGSRSRQRPNSICPPSFLRSRPPESWSRKPTRPRLTRPHRRRARRRSRRASQTRRRRSPSRSKPRPRRPKRRPRPRRRPSMRRPRPLRAVGPFSSPRQNRRRKPAATMARLTSKYGADLNGSRPRRA